MVESGVVLWLMGPTSSGKTTLGTALVERLRAADRPAILLDGDEMRELIGPSQGFSPDERLRTVRALAHLSNKVAKVGVLVVVAALTAYPDARAYIRDNVNNLLVGFVECSIDACAARDPKGLYAQAARGEIETLVGVNEAYQPPEAPDIILNTESESVEALVEKLMAFLGDRKRKPGRAP
jgi:adenylyl-sulfate kinase